MHSDQSSLYLSRRCRLWFPCSPDFWAVWWVRCSSGVLGASGAIILGFHGSLIAFALAKKYGISLVQGIFPREKYEKYSEWAGKSKSYTVLLFLGMVLPLFPDDFFCYFSGLTKMGMKKFATIIILGKPWWILAYSIAFAYISWHPHLQKDQIILRWFLFLTGYNAGRFVDKEKTVRILFFAHIA